ncbi:caspase family protein [Amycolatopsis sp. NPDC049252]|uniref:caspase family protein n=1 Tax=Amycolatopsis sp. NPDC049252 TaxID=3363933 RepID=UPI00372048C0
MAGRHALLIATETYADPALRRLTAPGGDARALAEVLSDPAIAGFEVTTLVDQPHHVVGEAIGEFYRGRRRDELTLLYFTGHGVKDDDGRLYLAMANTRRDSLMFTALAAEQVDRAMAGCASRQKVLVLDCCYSGAFPAGKLAKAGTDVHTLERFQGRGRAVLTASDATQYSFEGDEVVGSAARSVFTRHLVAGLRDGSADLDHDGDVTVDELYSYVHEHVVAEMPRQRPKHQSDVEGRIVLARNPRWTLPEYLRHGLASPIASDRLTALEGLRRLNRLGNEVVRERTEVEIRHLVDDDSRRVSAAAQAWVAAAAEPSAAEMSVGDVPVTEMSVAEVSATGVVEEGDGLPVAEAPVEAAPAVEEARLAEGTPIEGAPAGRQAPLVAGAAPAEPAVEEALAAPSIAPVAEPSVAVPTASAVEAVETLAAEPPSPVPVTKPDPGVPVAAEADPVVPVAVAKPDPVVPTAVVKPDPAVPVAVAKPDPAVAVAKADSVVPVAAPKKADPVVPVAVAKPDSVVPVAATKPDPAVPVAKADSVVPAAPRKPDPVVPAAVVKPDPAVPSASTKPDPAVPVAPVKPGSVVPPGRKAGSAAKAAPAQPRPAGPSVKRTAPPAPDLPGSSSARDARFYLGTAAVIFALATGILLSVGVGNWMVLFLLLLFAVFLGLGIAALRRQSK